MPVPLVAAVPAAVAVGAYLNARWRVSQDVSTIYRIASMERRLQQREAQDKCNSFYMLEQHASDHRTADKPFLIFDNKSWTFRETYDNVLRYANWLHSAHGISKDDVVALDFMNSAQFLFLIMALWSLGAFPALINYNLTGKPFLHCVAAAGAKLLIVDSALESSVLTPDTRDSLRAGGSSTGSGPLEAIVFDEKLESSLSEFSPHRAPNSARSTRRAADPAVYIFTSGTTGLPKPATVPWTRMFISAVFVKILGLRSADKKNPDRFYTCMPLYHTTAFALGFHLCLYNAVTIVIGRKFSASGFWNDVRNSEATAIQYVGETLRYLLAAPPSPDDRNHKVRVAWGNGLRPDVWGRFKARFGIETIAEIYGATEAAGASTNVSRNKLTEGAVGSYGAIAEFFTKRVSTLVEVDWETEKPKRDPKTGLCIPVGQGKVGEMMYQLDPKDIEAKFQGYVGNKKATEGKIVRDVLAKGDAYYRTGDTMRWEKDGLLFFSDRIGDTFRWRSENVSTAEVSEVMGHHPAIIESNVYGVEVPQHEGRAGCAAVVVRDDALQESKEGLAVKPEVLESLATYVTNSLPKYAVPLFLRVGRDFEVTGTNKQQKHILRNQGIDLAAIKKSGRADTMYWLKPGAGRYVPFGEGDLQTLHEGRAKL